MESLITESLDIEGLVVIRPNTYVRARDYLIETYNARTYAAAGVSVTFVQDNQALSIDYGTVQGLHFQMPPVPQAKLIRVIRGAIYNVAVDLRRGSRTYGRWRAVVLTAEGCEQLFVPRGFANGYCTVERETIVAHKVDSYCASTYEFGLRWDDPDLNIPWPVDPTAAIVSDADARRPPFKGFNSPFSV